MSRIYEYLQARGYKAQDEHIVIEGWPVQFLVPATESEKQAVINALPERFDDITIWVMDETFLVLIALQTGRRKDHLRILQLFEQGIVDLKIVEILIERYGLAAKWQAFKHRYLGAKMSKKEMRKRLAALPFAEKVRILEKLRDRSLAIAKVRAQRNSDEPNGPTDRRTTQSLDRTME